MLKIWKIQNLDTELWICIFFFKYRIWCLQLTDIIEATF